MFFIRAYSRNENHHLKQLKTFLSFILYYIIDIELTFEISQRRERLMVAVIGNVLHDTVEQSDEISITHSIVDVLR